MKIMHRRLFLAVAAVAAIIATLPLMPGREGALTRLQATGTVRIGYAVEPPFAFLGDRGEVTGEAPEVARHVVERLRIARIEWRQSEFGNLIRELEAGRIDVIATGLFITPERSRRVLFSRPTMRVRQALLVQSGNPGGIQSYAGAARRQDVHVAVLAGSVEEETMKSLGIDPNRLLRTPDARTGMKAVETGLADALLLSEPSLRWMLTQYRPDRFDVVVSTGGAEGEAEGRPAFAFRPDEADLHEAWDKELKGYLGSKEHLAMLASMGIEWVPPSSGEQR